MGKNLVAALLAVLLVGCTGVGVGGEFTQIVNERCVLLDGNAVELPRGMTARVDEGTIVEDPLIGGNTVVAHLGDQITGSASSRERSSGACGEDHAPYLRASSILMDVQIPAPSSSPSN